MNSDRIPAEDERHLLNLLENVSDPDTSFASTNRMFQIACLACHAIKTKLFLSSSLGLKLISTVRPPAFKNIYTGSSNCIRSYSTKLNTKVNPSKLFSLADKNESIQSTQKIIGFWLAGCSGLVFGAVILGGVTRLTESGLSMVTWRLLGEKLPVKHQDWVEEFHQYQQFPEFKIKNKDITLEEFKFIWWMEYAHRQWGRLIGITFFIPATVFWFKGFFPHKFKKTICVLGALISMQGLMGWYMVKSGLEKKFDGPSEVPRVSQYRLASHLSLAFVLYSLFLRSALDYLLPAEKITQISTATSRLRKLALGCKGLVFVTAISGAFVAGLDAGLIYNSFPKMADKWIPDDILSFSPTLCNVTENPTTVQFDHRILGISTLMAISGLWLLSRGKALPKRAVTATNAVALMAWLQVAMGITTLLTYVPVPIAAAHQSGSLLLLSLAVWLTHELKYLKLAK